MNQNDLPKSPLASELFQAVPDLDEDFLTEPLVGLCDKPEHLMSEEELREHVIYLRTLRDSYQTYKAEIERAESGKTKPARKATPVPVKIDESLNEFF